jgi:septum formation protein
MSHAVRLILASASPRRVKLLRDAGYYVQQLAPPFDDSDAPLDLPADQLAPALAQRKAQSVAQSLGQGIVIGCDTLLSLDDRTLGKPLDVDAARRMLKELLGRPHSVVTAVCLIDAATQQQHTFCETARVTIALPPPADIEGYLSSGAWRGKAGGYNLAELQARWQFRVEGDPTTVIGLPMRRLKVELQRFAPDLQPTRE